MAAPEEEEEATEKPLWLQDLLNGGSVEVMDLDDDRQGWCSPSADAFQVRGKSYMADKLKVSAGDWLLEPIALDWMKGTSRIDGVLRDPNNRVMSRVMEAREQGDILKPFVWAINLQIPSKDHHTLVAYYLTTAPFPEDSLVDRFLKGDDDFKNQRLKLIANIGKGPWIVKTAVGDHAICLLGKSLTCRYLQGENFFEVDVDIGSSMVASAIVHLATSYITSLTVDLAFLIEGRSEEELPEQILGTVRFAQLELTAAVPFKEPIPVVVPTDVSTKDVEDNVKRDGSVEEGKEALTFQSRLWKSFGGGLSGDWWGRQQV